MWTQAYGLHNYLAYSPAKNTFDTCGGYYICGIVKNNH